MGTKCLVGLGEEDVSVALRVDGRRSREKPAMGRGQQIDQAPMPCETNNFHSGT